MRSDKDFGEIIFFQAKRYLGEIADSIDHKERGFPLLEFFGPTQLCQQGSKVFSPDQLLKHGLIMIITLFSAPCKLPDRKPVVRRCNAQTGKFADIQIQFMKSWCQK